MVGNTAREFVAQTMSGDVLLANDGSTGLQDNTVGTGEVVDNSLESADIKDGTIATADLGDDSVTPRKSEFCSGRHRPSRRPIHGG